MAAWAVGQTERFKAAVMGAGISDWGMQAGTGEWGITWTRRSAAAPAGPAGPHLHDAVSPISFASRIRTPVLILHGAEEPTFLSGRRSTSIGHCATSAPNTSSSSTPERATRFHERDHQLDVLRRTRTWFDRWLGP